MVTILVISRLFNPSNDAVCTPRLLAVFRVPLTCIWMLLVQSKVCSVPIPINQSLLASYERGCILSSGGDRSPIMCAFQPRGICVNFASAGKLDVTLKHEPIWKRVVFHIVRHSTMIQRVLYENAESFLILLHNRSKTLSQLFGTVLPFYKAQINLCLWLLPFHWTTSAWELSTEDAEEL